MRKMRLVACSLIGLAIALLCSFWEHPSLAQTNLCYSDIIEFPTLGIDTDTKIYDVIYQFPLNGEPTNPSSCGREYWTIPEIKRNLRNSQPSYIFFYLVDGQKNRISQDRYIEKINGDLGLWNGELTTIQPFRFPFKEGLPEYQPESKIQVPNNNYNPTNQNNQTSSQSANFQQSSSNQSSGINGVLRNFLIFGGIGDDSALSLLSGHKIGLPFYNGISLQFPSKAGFPFGQDFDFYSLYNNSKIGLPISVNLSQSTQSANTASTSSTATTLNATAIVGTGTPASCTESALESALAGGGVIGFNCGSSPYTIPITSQKVISTTTTVDGGGLITLSGGGTTRVFSTMSNVTFTLQNITVANGFTSGQGGGLMSGYRGKLNLANCAFTNNVSTQSGSFDGGGAVYISSESTVTVNNCTFTGNSANNGGAINNLLSDLTVTNSTFTSNKSLVSGSGGGGGAIYIDGGNGSSGKISISGSKFSSNTAIFQGGGIFIQLYSGNTAVIDSSQLVSNQVTGSGSQGFGGGIFVINETTTISNSSISGNISNNQGGGIWMGNNATLNINNTTVTGNQAANLGGGLMKVSGNANLNGSTTISGNSAPTGANTFP